MSDYRYNGDSSKDDNIVDDDYFDDDYIQFIDDLVDDLEDLDDLDIENIDLDYDDDDSDDGYSSDNDYDDDSDNYVKFDYNMNHNKRSSDSAPVRKKQKRRKRKKKKVPQTMGQFVISEIISYVKIIVVAVLIAYLIVEYIIVNARVPSGSMRDTIWEDDKLIGLRLAYIFDEPERGDIVIFKYPDNEDEIFIKRLIGLPGDVVEIYGGHVYINGEMLKEDYIKEPMIDDGLVHTYNVPDDCYFMLGDNRNNSKDSRFWNNTFVTKKQIVAKASFRYYSGEEHKFKIGKLQ
ncbi:MAG: signal peptidase I [Lachnospira sp.]